MNHWRYFWREALAVVFMLAGIFGLIQALSLVAQRQVIGASVVGVFGLFVFRGGLSLLKVAMSARIVQQTQDRLYPAPAQPLPSVKRNTGTTSVSRASRPQS